MTKQAKFTLGQAKKLLGIRKHKKTKTRHRKSKSRGTSGMLSVNRLHGLMGTFKSLIAGLAGFGAFWKQINIKSPATFGTDTMTNVKTFANKIIGTVSGLNLFADAPQFTQTLNPLGFLNQNFIGGLIGVGIGSGAMFAGKRLGVRKLTETGSWVTKVSGSVALGAGVGGIFDDPQPTGAFSGTTQIGGQQASTGFVTSVAAQVNARY